MSQIKAKENPLSLAFLCYDPLACLNTKEQLDWWTSGSLGTARKWAIRGLHYRMSKACQDQDLTRVSSSLKHTLQRILHRTHRKSCRLPSKSPYPRSGWMGAHSIRRHPYPTRKGPFPFCLSLVSLPVPLCGKSRMVGENVKRDMR